METITGTSKYTFVKIGTQRWMDKNLDASRYRNGDKILQVRRAADWAALTTGAWCWYNNDSATGAIYGKLYNWYAVNDPRGLAPTGWHIPSDDEWWTLRARLGNNSGGKLKDTGTIEAGTGLWYFPNSGATNKTGFTGLPEGKRTLDGSFAAIGYLGGWWSSTDFDVTLAWNRTVFHYVDTLSGGGYDKRYGFAVRCVKD